MSHLGRLPPLQAIGRSHCVDLDEPPDLSDTEIDQFLDDYDKKDRVYTYCHEHASSAATGLEEHFRVLTPGGHVCKRSGDNATAFTHSRHSVAFSLKYAELRHMLQTRAQLQFVRDYTTRLNAAAMFVKDLEALVRDEYLVWYRICHNGLESPPVTKLECLSSICEDLRVHMNHWNSVKQLLYTDPWLRPQLAALVLQIHPVQTRLHQLRNTAIWWIDRLIQVGFRVLAYCDLERIGSDSLWSITRGLEDFNSIVMTIKEENLGVGNPRPSAVAFNSYQNIGETIKPVPFGRVLNLLANERSRYAAATTHQFFTSCRELLNISLGRRGLGLHSWGEEVGVKSRRTLDTSDYHTDTGSHVSLGTAMLRVGTVTAPDLSQEPSPLMDFARREKTFAQKFLQIVCQSTSLLKRPTLGNVSTTANVKTQKRSPLLAHTTTKPRNDDNDTSNMNGTLSTGQNNPDGTQNNTPNTTPKPPPRARRTKDRLDPDGPEISKKSGGVAASCSRKSVSWGDAGEVSVVQQLTQRYMDVLWQYFSASLMDQLTQPVWGGPDGVKGQLGSILLCSDLVLEVIVRMIQHTCAKDIFPVGGAAILSTVAERIRVTTAWRSWDIAMCSALASGAIDNCHPVLLVEGEHSSSTAKSLRDAFQPLHSAMHTLHTSLAQDNQSGSTRAVTMAMSGPTLERLLMTCQVALRWSGTRGNLYLNSWTLGAFLLITQSDFKILSDEVRHGITNSQTVCSTDTDHVTSHVTPEGRHKTQLADLQKQVESLGAQMQSLSGTLVKQFSEKCHLLSVEYFEEEMPSGKIWKKRQCPEGPLEPSPYVEHALDTLLEPIVAGANKLAAASQLSVISMATTAMCEAWTDVILQRKIKFSISGAEQLEEDFRLVRTWLETYIQTPPVRHSVLSLDIFKYLNAIIDILKRQPRGRSSSRPPDSRARPDDKSRSSVCCDVSVGTSSSDQWRDSSSNTAPPSSSSDSDADKQFKPTNQSPETVTSPMTVNDGDGAFKMPKMEQWLALRVHGGARSWPKLPSCFNNTHA